MNPEEQAAGVEPARLRPDDIPLKDLLTEKLTRSEKAAVEAYIRRIVVRRMVSMDEAAKQAEGLMLRFNRLFEERSRTRWSRTAFEQAMRLL